MEARIEPPSERMVTVTMTVTEAEWLRGILGRIGGDAISVSNTPRIATNHLDKALQGIGVRRRAIRAEGSGPYLYVSPPDC